MRSAKKLLFHLWLFFTLLGWGTCQAESSGKKPLSVLQRQAEAEDVGAQARVGSMYMRGEGVTKDVTLGFQWSYRAALAGSPLGARTVWSAYWDGRGVALDKQAAFEWAWIAASRGDADSHGALTAFYLRSDATGKAQTMAYAWALIRRAAGDKRLLAVVSHLESVLQDVQKAEGRALANAWARNKEHVMPIHSQWYFAHAAENASAEPKPKQFPGGRCGSGHWISSNVDEGKYIKLEDGSLWEIDDVDTVDSSLWLETDEITVCPGKLIDTDDNTSAGAKRVN